MTRFAWLLLLVIAVPSCRPAESAGANDSADIAAVPRSMEAATAAHAAGDSVGIADLFTEDAVIMPAGEPTASGRAQVLASFGAFFRNYTSQARIEPIETHIAGDWAWARTRVSGTLTPRAGGAPIELSAREIAILRRQSDGSWKVARLIGNSAPPERAGGG